MKIAQINTVCGVKSTGRIATDLALLLEERGHECKIAYGRDAVPEDLQKYAVRVGSTLSVYLHTILTRLTDGVGLGSKRATKKLIKWLQGYDPDVIHLHNLHGYYLHLPTLFSYLKEANKKVVWTLHDCWAFTGHCAHFDFCGCEKWKSVCQNCPQIKEYPKAYIDKSHRNYALKKQLFTGIKDMTIVTPSKWLAELVKQSFLKEYPVQVIPNGIDLTKFRRADSDLRRQYGLQEKKIVLGAATAWGEKKGLQDFYRLSQLLDEGYQVVMIGLTKEQISAAPSRVLALPVTADVESLAKWYTTADVFVNCTYEDTYPTVNLEAQACGTPVVTYATGGSVESVPSENVIPKGDVEKLAERIPQVIEEKRMLDITLFGKGVTMINYLDIYKG